MAHFYLFDHLLNFVFVFDHRTALPVTHRQSLVTQSLGLLEFLSLDLVCRCVQCIHRLPSSVYLNGLRRGYI